MELTSYPNDIPRPLQLAALPDPLRASTGIIAGGRVMP